MGAAREFLSKNIDIKRAEPMLPQSVVFLPMPGTVCSIGV
jgi:hypothetical protein